MKEFKVGDFVYFMNYEIQERVPRGYITSVTHMCGPLPTYFTTYMKLSDDIKNGRVYNNLDIYNRLESESVNCDNGYWSYEYDNIRCFIIDDYFIGTPGFIYDDYDEAEAEYLLFLKVCGEYKYKEQEVLNTYGWFEKDKLYNVLKRADNYNIIKYFR